MKGETSLESNLAMSTEQDILGDAALLSSHQSGKTLDENATVAGVGEQKRTTRLTVHDNNPDWFRARQRNIRESRLFQVDESLILLILDHTDDFVKDILRRTCSLFMRILSARKDRYDKRDKLFVASLSPGDLAGSNMLPPTLHDERRIWPRQSLLAPTGLAALAARQSDQCVGCRRFADSGRACLTLSALRIPFWCVSCLVRHPSVFFPHHDRLIGRSGPRECFMQKGLVRLCEHVSLNWGDIERMQNKAAWSQGLWRESKNTVTRSDGHEVCTHPSHPSCPEYWLDEAKSLPGFRNSGQKEAARLQADSERSEYLNLGWTMPLFKLDTTRPISRDDLRNIMQSAKATPSGAALCPHVRLDDGQLLLAFEHNHCACFEGPNDSCSGRGVPYADCHGSCEVDGLGHRTDLCCRSATVGRRELRGSFMGSAEVAPDAHTYKCAQCPSRYTWLWLDRDREEELDSDGKHVGRVGLRCERRVALSRSSLEGACAAPNGVGSEWLWHLDPGSWGITEDQELKHIVWCDEPRCSTTDRWTTLYGVLRREQKDWEAKMAAKAEPSTWTWWW